MEIDRKTVVQIVVSVIAVGIFIGGLVAVTNAYGIVETAEEEPLEGTLTGEFDEYEEVDGDVTGQFTGTYDNEFEGTLDGDVKGTVDDGVLTADLNGTVSGAIDGTASGEMNGTIEENGDVTFDGTFTGTATGETQTTLSPDGGLVLVLLIVGYIVILPLLGYFIERYEFEESES